MEIPGSWMNDKRAYRVDLLCGKEMGISCSRRLEMMYYILYWNNNMTMIELPRINEFIFGSWFGYVKYINMGLDGTSLVINDLNGIVWCLWIELCLNNSLDY